MKFAIVEGVRVEAQPSLLGLCETCQSVVIAKCGKWRIWHWAHKGERQCDVWWEPETEWHRNWKNHFPQDWQEVRHVAQDGEIHRADVKTDFGVVVEFQHSFLHDDEHAAREAFYGNMIWVVDAQRRKLDVPNFVQSLQSAFMNYVNFRPLRVALPLKSNRLFSDWHRQGGQANVFFDFGEDLAENRFNFAEPMVWWMVAVVGGNVGLQPIKKSEFIDALLNGRLPNGLDASQLQKAIIRQQAQNAMSLRLTSGFQAYRRRHARSRRRF